MEERERQKVLFKVPHQPDIKVKGELTAHPIYTVHPLKITVLTLEGDYKGSFFDLEEKDLICLIKETQ